MFMKFLEIVGFSIIERYGVWGIKYELKELRLTCGWMFMTRFTVQTERVDARRRV